MKKYIFVLGFLLPFFSISQEVEQKIYQPYVDRAGITKCNNLISKNFEFFNHLSDQESHIESNNFQSPDQMIKTLRIYFNYGYKEPIVGDLSVIETNLYCQSFLNISTIDETVSCDNWKFATDDKWRDIIKQDTINWANNNRYNILLQDLSNKRGCQMTIFITDLEFF